MAPPVKEVSRVLAALQKRVDVHSRREDGLYEEFRHYCGSHFVVLRGLPRWQGQKLAGEEPEGAFLKALGPSSSILHAGSILVQESEAELPQLQLQLVEADRKRRGLLEEIQAIEGMSQGSDRCQVQEKDAAACKSALQSARAIGSEEFKSFQKDLSLQTCSMARPK